MHSQQLLSLSDELMGKCGRGGKVTEEPRVCVCVKECPTHFADTNELTMIKGGGNRKPGFLF